jgi:putative ABC transport system ATP-binding protein
LHVTRAAAPDELQDADACRGYPILAAGLVRRYTTPGGVTITAVDGVDLDLPAGSVTALAGPSGSGKSTLLHLLGGMDQADQGTIRAGRTEVTALSRSRLVAYRRTVGFVFQHFALLPALTARDNVMLPVLPYKADFNRSERATQLLAEVGLAGRENALPFQLSGGQRQRVAIARALMNHPRLLLADEPTGNLDSTTGNEVFNLLLGLREERGLTIVLASHDEALAGRCDRVIHLRDGQILGAAPRQPEHATRLSLKGGFPG